jgi:hypothetical protein
VSFEDMPNVNSNPLPKLATSGVRMVEVGNQSKGLKVSMKKLHGMLVQSRFLKMNNEHNLEGSDIVSSMKRRDIISMIAWSFTKQLRK